MTKVEAIEKQVEKLSRQELASFREWFAEHDWSAWDRELEEDVAAGRLDKFADEVLDEHKRGKTTEL